MIARTRCAETVNAVANHPDVRPFIGGAGPLDMTALLADRANVALFGPHGGFFYHWCAPGVFEVHTLILPAGRGADALADARLSLDVMADEFGASMVWTRVRRDLRHVRLFARAAGMKPAGRRCFDLGDGPHEYDLLTWRA
jgi:hypothetical protein